MIFRPVKLAKEYKFRYAFDFEELNISSFDGIKLNGLLFKAKDPKGLVFYLHGNYGALNDWGGISTVYTNLGYDFFILDYRGFGKSEGSIDNEEQFYKDVSAAYQQMEKRYPESKIVVAGYSIGTGAAAYLAANNRPKALILQSPYYNLAKLTASKFPFVPEFVQKYKFMTNKFLPKVKVPVYIFHGKEDQVIGFENSVELQKHLKAEDQFFPLENQDHNGMNENAVYNAKLSEILK